MHSINANKQLSRLITSILLVSCFSCFTNASELDNSEMNQVSNASKQQVLNPVNSIYKENKLEISYKVLSAKVGEEVPAAVYIGDKEVIRYVQSAGGYSPEVRAKILVSRLNQFIEKKENPKSLLPVVEKGIVVGRTKNLILFTADVNSAKAEDLSVGDLALKWVNNIRLALGAPKVVRDHKLIASRSNISAAFSRNFLGKVESGKASWYGGRFHGRRAADGSVFNKNALTAAHKTLPFGTLVKVINQKNGKSCIVKITDRGPFIPGRIIDLSRAAAQEIGMLSSGVSKVKIEVVGKE